MVRRAVLSSLPSPARVGFEACGNTQWFEDLLDGLGHEVWIGDAAEIRASYVRKQKTDRRNAAHILKLLIEDRFPCLWRPNQAERDLRQLLIHRHRLVGIRTRVMNGLQHLMLNRGVQLKRKMWSEVGQKLLRELPLEGWAAQRRQDLLNLLGGPNPQIISWTRPWSVLRRAPASAPAHDATWRRSHHGLCLCNHDGGCNSLPAWQAGCQLSGSDPERAQLE